MSVMNDVFSEYTDTYQTRKESEMGLVEYLELCGTDPMAFASAAERMMAPGSSAARIAAASIGSQAGSSDGRSVMTRS